MTSMNQLMLNSTFQKRTCLKPYSPMGPKLKEFALNLFQKNPNMKPYELHEIEIEWKLEKNKLVNFFKNEKLKDFKKNKKFIQKMGSYKIFNDQDKEILENYFRINPVLNKETLLILLQKLSIKSKKKIAGWFDYRKRKFNKKVSEVKNTVKIENTNECEKNEKNNFVQIPLTQSNNLQIGNYMQYFYFLTPIIINSLFIKNLPFAQLPH